MKSLHHQPSDVFMNVKQVSAYLQINQKKVYDMVNRGIIPATKITGKWMFPKELVDKWMLDSTHNGLLRDRLIIAGTEDPFLARVIHEFSRDLGNKAVIAFTNTSTHAGLELLNTDRVDVCCLHWGPAKESLTRHPSLIQQYSSSASWILIHAFQREQGLLFISADEHKPVIADFFERKFRWDVISGGSGTQRFLLEVLSKNGLNIDDLNTTSHSLSDREAAAAIHLNRCDVAPGTRATANVWFAIPQPRHGEL